MEKQKASWLVSNRCSMSCGAGSDIFSNATNCLQYIDSTHLCTSSGVASGSVTKPSAATISSLATPNCVILHGWLSEGTRVRAEDLYTVFAQCKVTLNGAIWIIIYKPARARRTLNAGHDPRRQIMNVVERERERWLWREAIKRERKITEIQNQQPDQLQIWTRHWIGPLDADVTQERLYIKGASEFQTDTFLPKRYAPVLHDSFIPLGT